MAYLSLYRKYRPQRFADVTGQTPVVRTLQNALERGRVAHAYMFSGPRGTGKTTLARLLAKGLNCENGPAAEPCNVCANCQRINDGAAMDVIEIDGASNRGIDEIRDLRENVRFASTEGGHKVYIIDEVHMLTTDAFNALLKTLEEPPEHVVFVLATTESHKVPETIASRCQRFEFRNFTTEQLMGRLQQVVEAEELQVAPGALRLIARHAAGGMRDALALLDQAVSFQAHGIEEEHIAELLGVVPADQLWKLLDSLAEGKGLAAITHLHQLIGLGADPAQLAKDCVSFLRELMLHKAQHKEVDPGTEWSKLPGLVAMELEQTLSLIDALAQATANMRWMSPTWLPLEMAIIRSTEGAPRQDGSSEESAAGERETQHVAGPMPEEGQSTTSTPPSSRGQEEFQSLLAHWDQVSELLRQERNAPVEAFLREATPIGLDGDDRLVLAFSKDKEFHKASLEQPKHKEALQRSLSRIMGRAVEVRCCYEDEVPEVGPADKVGPRTPSHEPQNAESGGDALEMKTSNPALDAALRLFGGTVVEVKADSGEESEQ